MRKYINDALKILTKIFADGTYSNMALYGENLADMTTKLVYDVLEQNVRIEYIINSLVDKKPQNAIYNLLKIGVSALENLTDVPAFAIVSECVEVAKSNGKGGASGFVNAVLKKVARKEYKLPSPNDKNYFSIIYSKPQWFIDKLVSQYGEDKTFNMLSQPVYDLEHIRVNKRLTQQSSIKNKLQKSGQTVSDSQVGGLIVKGTSEIKKLFYDGLVTFQSPSSMLAVKALAPTDGAKILDICSAPGGKAVYLSELCPHSFIYACDLHPHRIALIHKYMQRMHVTNVKPILLDATKFKAEWENSFDYVLVDAPCSCFGTYRKHPDVFLSRGIEDIKALVKTQRSILSTASKYLKSGGILVYSTCTLFYEENQGIIEEFLKKNDFAFDIIKNVPFDNLGTIQLLPHEEWDGFYIARLKKL